MMYKMLLGAWIMASASNFNHQDAMDHQNLSHEKRDSSLDEAINHVVEKIKGRMDLPYITVVKQLEIVGLLVEFDLGRFLIERGGLNGYWTDYVVKHPGNGRLTGLNHENHPFNALERFLLNKAPTVLATQQRFEIFKAEIQKRLRDGFSLASIPCGLMADLLDLDYSKVADIRITGIDLDPESLEGARQKTNELVHCEFLQRDAWELDMHDAFDLVTSNGLAIYEPDDEKVVLLYRGFWESLKPGGWLVTSFLTPPPAPGFATEWKMDAVDRDDALFQKIVFSDILATKWQIYRSEALVRSQLQQAGFGEIEVVYDAAHIFPTIIARKPA